MMNVRNSNGILNDKNFRIALFAAFAIPLIIYIYFLNWRTDVIYGDDLYMFKEYARLNSFSEKMKMPLSFDKFRPVHGLSLQIIIEWFQKNISSYYIFNVSIQALNTIIFALIANMFLRSPVLSLLFGLIIGLTRFSYFNIAQLLNGGALEGLAITFFLLCLYYIIRALKQNERSVSQKQNDILWSMLFANLSMYTHERYIVIFPFLFIVILLIPSLKTIPVKRRILLVSLAPASVILNIVLKKYVYGIPFFVGTGGTNIEFSFATSIQFFKEALLSIFQINSGPQYLVGRPFSDLSDINKTLAILIFISFLVILVLYLLRVKTFFAKKQVQAISDFRIFCFLLVLFGLFLVPAIATFRLEQRWLQASLFIVILMTIIALTNIPFRNMRYRNAVLAGFVLLFIWTDFNYLNKGVPNLYMSDSKRLAKEFKQAFDKDVIHPNTSKLHIWMKHRDANSESAINWTLGSGYFFEFYGSKNKEIIFTDSIYQRGYNYPVSSFINFNGNKEQIVFIGNDVFDITDLYLRDSLKNFDIEAINNVASSNTTDYSRKQLLITNDDLSKFTNSGFYDNENGIRWTNGDARITFNGAYKVSDTLRVEMKLYLPPPCAFIKPQVLVTDQQNSEFKPATTTKLDDKFIYTFHFDSTVAVQSIRIVSDTIPNVPPEARKLSFPFISLELNK